MSDIADQKKGEKVVVAMSGGVDSSAAALLLHEAGYGVVGVAMQVWDYRNNGGNSKRATCCAPADFDDARRVAELKELPFYVFDFEDSFHEAVIAPFVNSYLTGYTPNPCVECNRHVKFKELRKRAKSLGATRVATGHYAQIKPVQDNKLGLFTSKDLRKDQSYFLFAITQDELHETLFPVGRMQKSEVREYLRNNGVLIAEKAESQDICFVSGSASEFVEKEAKMKPQPGKITRADGTVLGEHDGIHNFTIGQRRGIGVGFHERLYVLNILPEDNTVQVGYKEELERGLFSVERINWISGEVPTEPFSCRVKVRYRHDGLRCKVVPLENGAAEIIFDSEWTAISPGQSAVFYALEPDAEGDYQVLGGGTISR
jgi:tRNA-specific 2-thiouridylase